MIFLSRFLSFTSKSSHCWPFISDTYSLLLKSNKSHMENYSQANSLQALECFSLSPTSAHAQLNLA